MAKTLIIHRHSEKTPGGNHISTAGRLLATITAAIRYRGKKADHMFWSPLIRTLETAIAMMVGNASFDNAIMHDPVVGLGTSETMTLIVTDKFKDATAGGMSKLEALLNTGEAPIIKVLAEEAEEGLRRMFSQMSDGQLGVGIFHDPLISLAAWWLGLKDARSLESMEAIVFTMNDDGMITASWPDIN